MSKKTERSKIKVGPDLQEEVAVCVKIIFALLKLTNWSNYLWKY